ncbi:MAG: hypothetical protein AB1742_09615 [bacterium]
MKKIIVKSLSKSTKLDKREAEAFLNVMAERYTFLFPPEMKDRFGPFFMIMRNETPAEVKPFDYSKIQISGDPVPPRDGDIEMVRKINQLDRRKESFEEYDEWENLFHELIELCPERFSKWLQEKKASDEMFFFPHCIHVYISFIYGYMHEDVVTLKRLPKIYVREFFEDHLLRKENVEPQEYTNWPPALKYFYVFLHEMDYIEDPGRYISRFDGFERPFLAHLQKRFG